MNNPIRIHRVSFRHAFDGIIHNFKTQPNFRFHFFAAFLATAAGLFFRVNFIEWMVLFFTFNMVIVAEMVNTTVEAIVDLITQERRQDAKVAKDVSAGMVLIAANFAIVIGLYIFVPKIIVFITNQ